MLKRLNINKSDLLEYYVTALLILGLPLVALVYFDWRAALTMFLFTQTVVGLLAVKGTDKVVAE